MFFLVKNVSRQNLTRQTCLPRRYERPLKTPLLASFAFGFNTDPNIRLFARDKNARNVQPVIPM
jgi:hypothetical protein